MTAVKTKWKLEFPKGYGPKRPAILKRGNAVIGRIVWNSTIAGSGYRYMPNNAARQSSRVLRPSIHEVLIKATGIPSAKVRILIQDAATA